MIAGTTVHHVPKFISLLDSTSGIDSWLLSSETVPNIPGTRFDESDYSFEPYEYFIEFSNFSLIIESKKG